MFLADIQECYCYLSHSWCISTSNIIQYVIPKRRQFDNPQAAQDWKLGGSGSKLHLERKEKWLICFPKYIFSFLSHSASHKVLKSQCFRPALKGIIDSISTKPVSAFPNINIACWRGHLRRSALLSTIWPLPKQTVVMSTRSWLRGRSKSRGFASVRTLRGCHKPN